MRGVAHVPFCHLRSWIPAARCSRRPSPAAAHTDVEMVSGLRAPSSSEIAVGGAVRQGWWLVVDEETGPGRVVAGPFPDRAETGWAADALDHDGADEVRAIYGIGRADGGVDRRPSPHDWAWLSHLSARIDTLPAGWDAGLPE